MKPSDERQHDPGILREKLARSVERFPACEFLRVRLQRLTNSLQKARDGGPSR